MKSSEVLRAALERMDGGRKWCKHNYYEGAKCCSYGAMRFVTSAERYYAMPEYVLAKNHLRDAIGDDEIALWNDSASDFSVIEKGFRDAIALAIAEGD